MKIQFDGFWIFIALVVLKLANIISWSWWVVTAPLWVPFILGLVLLIAVVIYAKILDWKRRNK